jgi:hypothetical protein
MRTPATSASPRILHAAGAPDAQFCGRLLRGLGLQVEHHCQTRAPVTREIACVNLPDAAAAEHSNADHQLLLVMPRRRRQERRVRNS